MSDTDFNPTPEQILIAAKMTATIKLAAMLKPHLTDYMDMLVFCAACEIDYEHAEVVMGKTKFDAAMTTYYQIYLALFDRPINKREEDNAATILTLVSDMLWDNASDKDKQTALNQLPKGNVQ